MAAVPSVVNLINNHLSTMDKEKITEDNYKNSSESILPESYNDKDHLVLNDGESLIEEKNDYVNIYKKFWPFRFLKMTNFLFLLLLAIGASLTSSYSIRWSTYWKTLLFERPYDMGSSFAVGLWILFIFAFCSLIIHHFAKNTFLAGIFSLMDICFYAISILILSFSNIIFSTKSIAEYLWFGPKLANFNYTFEAYVNLTESMSDCKSSYYYLYKDGYDNHDCLKSLVENRKKQLLVNLLIDPTSAILSAFALILNVFMIFILYKKMKKANLWAVGLNNYKSLFPECSQIEQKYSCHYPFGMFKTFLWLLPTMILFSIIYFPFFKMNLIYVKHYILASIIYFIHWLLYYCNVHLNYTVKRNNKFNRLSLLFHLDLLISLIFTILFILNFSQTYAFESFLFLLASILYGAYLLMLIFVYWSNNNGKSFKLFNFEQLPISIKINIEISNRKPIPEEKHDEQEKIVEINDEKEKNNENKN